MTKLTHQADATPRSKCPVACTLDILGDKWTLLVVRDLWWGSQTYNYLQNQYENMPTNILADRLRRLLAVAVIEKVQYQVKPIRYTYQLTEKGRELGPILFHLLQWGAKNVAGSEVPPNMKAFLEANG